MGETSNRESEPLLEIFDDFPDIDSEGDDDVQPEVGLESDEDDVEAHGGGGFNRPE